jgi:hypothetical protein
MVNMNSVLSSRPITLPNSDSGHPPHTNTRPQDPNHAAMEPKDKWLTKTFLASIFLGIGGFLYG